jgi:hypothetical protein
VSAHVFVDETKERGYVVAAAVVLPSELAATRQAIRPLILPGQRRIHFSHESDPRRRKILDTIIDLGVSAMIYDGTSYPNKKRVRDAIAWCWARGGHWRTRV